MTFIVFGTIQKSVESCLYRYHFIVMKWDYMNLVANFFLYKPIYFKIFHQSLYLSKGTVIGFFKKKFLGKNFFL
jgi:hypothetical protein